MASSKVEAANSARALQSHAATCMELFQYGITCKRERVQGGSHGFRVHLQRLIVTTMRVLKVFVRSKLHLALERRQKKWTTTEGHTHHDRKQPCHHLQAEHCTRIRFAQHAMQSNASIGACRANGADANQIQYTIPDA
jgi:hypothetical protein